MKIAHLNMIQGIIARMADNSFKIKGWIITFIIALSAISINNKDENYFFIGLILILGFCCLDIFYFRQENLFRTLYKDIANKDEEKIDF